MEVPDPEPVIRIPVPKSCCQGPPTDFQESIIFLCVVWTQDSEIPNYPLWWYSFQKTTNPDNSRIQEQGNTRSGSWEAPYVDSFYQSYSSCNYPALSNAFHTQFYSHFDCYATMSKSYVVSYIIHDFWGTKRMISFFEETTWT